MKKVYGFCKNIITVIFGGIVFWLFLMSLFTVCFINSVEHTYFAGSAHDTVIKLLALLAVFIIIILLRGRFSFKIDVRIEKTVEYVLLAIIFAGCLLWVLTVRSTAVSDQQEVMNAAVNFLNGDYKAFEPGGYIAVHTVQLGLTLVHYILTVLFGKYNYLIFQILSAIAVTLTWKQLYDIIKLTCKNRIDALAVLVVGILFLPFTFYSTFVYGTVIGFSLVMAAVKYAIMYMNERKYKHILLSGIFISLGILCKTNYLIILIGMIAAFVVWAFSENNKRSYVEMFAAVVFLCFMFWIQSLGVRIFFESRTGQALNNSLTSISFLEMGLQDNGTRGPGWYNGYNDDTFFAAECNSTIQKEIVKNDLKATLSDMKAHKGDTLKFFAKKTASQWMNPSFEALWTVQQTGTTNTARPEYISDFISPKGNIIFTGIFSVIEFILFFGVFLFACEEIVFIICKDSINDVIVHHSDVIEEIAKFILEITFIGGFVFYMFWEAKGQYTIVYMVLLSPFSVKGFVFLTQLIDVYTNKEYKKDLIDAAAVKKLTAVLGTILGTGLFIIVLSFFNVHARDLIRLDDDIEEFNNYKAYYFEQGSKNISGNVKIVPFLNDDTAIVNDGESVFCDESGCSVGVKGDGAVYRLTMPDNRCLFGYMNGDSGYNLEAGIRAENDGQLWRIIVHDDGRAQLYLACGYALTYDDESNNVYLSKLSDSDSQMWYLW